VIYNASFELLKKLEPYKITRDEDMPWVYQKANPVGRWKHDDWIAFKNTPRMETAYRIPQPYKMVAGNAIPEETPLPLDYPLVPGAAFEIKPWTNGQGFEENKKWVWMIHPVQPAGKWARLACYLPDGTWVECFQTYSFNFFGNKIPVYEGIKHDPHPVDCMCWSREMSISIKWGKLT